MEVRIVLNIMWIAIGIGVVTIIPTSLFFFQTLNVEMIQLISVLCLGYVPYTLFYKKIPSQWQAPLLIVNCIAVISIFYYLAPYMGHTVFYFVPLFGMFFRQVKLFIFSVVVSGIAYIGVLQLVGGPETDWVYFTMNLSFFACYNIILYFLMSVVVSTTTSKVEAEKGIESLILAIEMVDDYTKGHSKRVQEYSLLFGETLKRAGYPVDLDVLSTSSILHDVGKLQIPAAILQKKGRLTNEEFEVIKKHPEVGAEIAEKLNYSKDIICTIYHHHERYDGKGYPSQIAGENIPFLSRVITVCDTFDALTSNRSYRNALTPQQAKEIILENMGTQFDPSFEPYFRQVYPSLEEIALNKSEVQIAPTLFCEKYGS